METVNNNEAQKILTSIPVLGYEQDAAGNLIIKTTISDACDALVHKLDSRNFLSRPVEIKDGDAVIPGYIFSVHEFFTDMLLAELAENPAQLDPSEIKKASRTYDQQKNVRTIYTWTSNKPDAAPSVATTVSDCIYFSNASFDQNGFYRLRMYRNGPERLHKMICSILGRSTNVLSRPDGKDYLISPEEFSTDGLEEIRKFQYTKNAYQYKFTYDELAENMLVDMGPDIEIDVPENCILLLDGCICNAKHISIVEPFDVKSVENFTLLVFNGRDHSKGSMGLLDRWNDEQVWLSHFFNASTGEILETVGYDRGVFVAMLPKVATPEDVNIYNSKLRANGVKYNPEDKSIKPIIESLKPGDVYYRPEFDAVLGEFVTKECQFTGSADEFTIIIEKKLGFKSQNKCDALVEFYNNSLTTAFSQDSAASELFENNV